MALVTRWKEKIGTRSRSLQSWQSRVRSVWGVSVKGVSKVPSHAKATTHKVSSGNGFTCATEDDPSAPPGGFDANLTSIAELELTSG